MKINKKLLLGLTSILALGMFMGGVKAEWDISSDNGGTSGGCRGKDSCWLYAGGSINHPVYGIRISIVDENGKIVDRTKPIDYLADQIWVDKVNNNTSYLRYADTNGGIVNRLSLLINPDSASLRTNTKKEIAKLWPKELGVLPYIYEKGFDTANFLKEKLNNLSNDQLINLFFNSDNLEYTIPNYDVLENHYIIFEPLTMVSAYNKSKIYYGTYYELTKELIKKYNYQNSDNNGKSWIATVLDMSLPLSMYITGNKNITGYNSSNGTYFNGKLKITKDDYKWFQDKEGTKNDRWRVKTDYVKDGTIGYGIGILRMKDIIKLTCNYGNDAHFATDTSGPNGENCCDYVMTNPDEYNFVTYSQLVDDHPSCGTFSKKNVCTANISFDGAICNTKNSIRVLDNFSWNCIYESAYSNDDNWHDYFLEKGDINTPCSISCEYQVDFEYPNGQIDVLAGNRFSISYTSSSYSIGVNPATNMSIVTPATLGPIMSRVEKHCVISGDRNACINEIKGIVSDIKAPTLFFEYNSNTYGNQEIKLEQESEYDDTYEGVESFIGELTTYYKLPDNTYKFASKHHGVSYKNNNNLSSYYEIGPHAPIHFEEPGTLNYTIRIDSFNVGNFDKYIKEGAIIASKYETTIETYIKRLIKLEELKLKNVNDIYYFSNSFTKLLENPQRKTSVLDFSIDNFLSMSCANTNTYSCSSDPNGLYCLDKDPNTNIITNTNNEDTYERFKSCIKNNVDEIKYDNTNFKEESLEYTCDFNVIEDINTIFRTISLNNPFPGKDGDGRLVGSNWGYGEDTSPDNEVVKSVITNNRGVETDKVYRELDPLYKITLTPALIKRIREYNETNDYSDFNLECNAQGEKCTSTFIRETFESNFIGCGIKNKSTGLTCNNDNEKWND